MLILEFWHFFLWSFELFPFSVTLTYVRTIFASYYYSTRAFFPGPVWPKPICRRGRAAESLVSTAQPKELWAKINNQCVVVPFKLTQIEAILFCSIFLDFLHHVYYCLVVVNCYWFWRAKEYLACRITTVHLLSCSRHLHTNMRSASSICGTGNSVCRLRMAMLLKGQ